MRTKKSKNTNKNFYNLVIFFNYIRGSDLYKNFVPTTDRKHRRAVCIFSRKAVKTVLYSFGRFGCFFNLAGVLLLFPSFHYYFSFLLIPEELSSCTLSYAALWFSIRLERPIALRKA